MYMGFCPGDNVNLHLLDVEDESITYVFASKDTQVKYLSLDF